MVVIYVLLTIILISIISSLHTLVVLLHTSQLVTIINYSYFTKTLSYWKKRGVNGPTPIPIVGNFLDLFFSPINIIEERRLLKYGPVYGTFQFSVPVITIADPELIREVTIKQFHNFTNRYNPNPGDEFQKKSLFTMEDDTWKTVRSIISPVFTASKMKRMYLHVDNCVDNTLQYIESISVKRKEVILKDVTTSYTLDTICKCIFGVETNGYKNPNDPFIERAKEFIDFKVWRILLSFVVPIKLQKPLNLQIIDEKDMQYLKNTMKNIIAQRRNSDIKIDDFINNLLDREEVDHRYDINDVAGDHYNNQSKEDLELQSKAMNSTTTRMLEEDEIISNCMLFFIAGYETTSTLLNYTFYCLAIKPDVQETLYSEIRDFLNGKQDIDYNELQELKHLDAVICESMRLYTPVVNLNRITAHDTTLGDAGILVEKGTVINLSFYAMHHNPHYFPEPHEFKPERFYPENKHLIKPYTFLPFGVGPRNCIGMRFALMSAKLFLVKVLSRFEVLKTENTVLNPTFTAKFINLECEPLFVKFVERN